MSKRDIRTRPKRRGHDPGRGPRVRTLARGLEDRGLTSSVRETIRVIIGQPGGTLGNGCSPAGSADRRSPVLSVVSRWSAAPARPRRSWQTPDAAPCASDFAYRCCPLLTGRFLIVCGARREPRRGSERRAPNSSPAVQRSPLPSISAGRRLMLVRRCRRRTAHVRAVGSQLGSQTPPDLVRSRPIRGSWEPAPRPRNSEMNSSSVYPRSASMRSKASRPR
jgi:hypothetical protein